MKHTSEATEFFARTACDTLAPLAPNDDGICDGPEIKALLGDIISEGRPMRSLDLCASANSLTVKAHIHRDTEATAPATRVNFLRCMESTNYTPLYCGEQLLQILMALKPSSLDEKIKEVRQAALRYCGTADTNLKHALIQAEERLNHAKREFLRLEEETSKLTSKYSLKRLSRIMEITNSIVDQKPMGTQDLKPSDIDAIRRYYIPYVQQKKVIEMRSKEFELIQRRIALNAEIYMQYKEELDNVTTE